MKAQELELLLNAWLQPQLYRDYCPNGLQVDNKRAITHVALAVTASLVAIQEAAALGADALIVHHGLFWKGEALPLTGWKYARVAALIQADLALLAYHLPLDGHEELGNNTQLAAAMNWQITERFGEAALGFLGTIAETLSASLLAANLTQRLNHQALLLGDESRSVRRIAWCTGSGASYYLEAVARGADAFVTGEVSEPFAHLARECGVPIIAAGHHATERFGVQALGEKLRRELGLQTSYIEITSEL